MSAWQPIDTAPKDEDVNLLLFEAGPYSRVKIGHWFAGLPAGEVFDIALPAQWEDDGEGFQLSPTHWMPLPEPPQ